MLRGTWAAMLIWFCVAQHALAQTPRQNDVARREADVLYKAGATAYKQENYAGAAASFEEALRLLPEPPVYYAAAQAHRLHYQTLGTEPERVARALALYEAYLERVKRGGRRGDAITHRDTMRALASKLSLGGRLASRDETPRIQVAVSVESAEISLDGEPIEPSETRDVKAGEHIIRVAAPGHRLFEKKLMITKGTVVIPASLEPLPALLRLQNARHATVLIDGRLTQLRGDEVDLPAGEYFVAVARRGRAPFAAEVALAPGETQQLVADLPITGQRKVAWGVLGTAGALTLAASTAGVLTWLADAEAGDLLQKTNKSSADAAAYEDARRRRDVWRNVTVWTGIGAATLGLLGGGLYWYDRNEAPAPTRRRQFNASPIVTPNGLGASLEGEF